MSLGPTIMIRPDTSMSSSPYTPTSIHRASPLFSRSEASLSRSLRAEDALPSPPPTRPGSRSTGNGMDRDVEEEMDVVDVGHWQHPLDNKGHHTDEEEEQDDDVLKSPVEDHYRDLQSNRITMPDSRSSPVVRRSPHLRLDLKPPSPQPWDLVHPPEHNGKKDYYSTMGSRGFDTLHSRNAPRPSIPKSSYYYGPPPSESAYGTRPMGQIGLHHPREILRVERDYSGGELVQFAPAYPLELEGRITPTKFLESINDINEILISAYSLRHSFLHNVLAVFTLQISTMLLPSHYEKEMSRLKTCFDTLNASVYHPSGLALVWPQNVAFLFLEIEYY